MGLPFGGHCGPASAARKRVWSIRREPEVSARFLGITGILRVDTPLAKGAKGRFACHHFDRSEI